MPKKDLFWRLLIVTQSFILFDMVSSSNKVDGIITKTQCSHFPLMIWNQITSDLGPTMIGLLCQETTYSFIFGRLGIRNLRIFAFLHTAPKCDQQFFRRPCQVTFYSFSENVWSFLGGERSVFFPSETQTRST